MSIFSDYRVNVRSGEIGGDSGDKVYLSAPGLLIAQYQSIEKSLHRVRGVRQVRRIELIPSERRHFELDTLLRHVAYPVLSVDRDGRIVAANQAAARAFGVSHSQVAGMALQRFLPRLQLAELLRGITAPRYGFPVTVRGREFVLDWSPIALAEAPGDVASLAGAVLTLQKRERESAPGQTAPAPQVLWDLDRRRDSCLRLQQMAPLGEPLLICGERGSGKSTFLRASCYLSPLAEYGLVREFSGAGFQSEELTELRGLATESIALLDDLHLVPAPVQQLLAEYLLQGRLAVRLILTTTSYSSLVAPLRQLLEVQRIQLPPLRSMRPALAGFVEKIVDDAAIAFDPAVFDTLALHDWPTNLAGLSDVVRAAVAHAQDRGSQVVEVEDVPAAGAYQALPWRDWGRGLTFKQQMEKVERAILAELVNAPAAGAHSTRELARRLGISHTAVANKLRKYGLKAVDD